MGQTLLGSDSFGVIAVNDCPHSVAQSRFLEPTPGFCCACHQPWGRMAKFNQVPLPPAPCRLAVRDVPGEGLGTAAAAADNQ